MPIRFSRYMEVSRQIMTIFRQYDPEMCPAGCDEAYIKSVFALTPLPRHLYDDLASLAIVWRTP